MLDANGEIIKSYRDCNGSHCTVMRLYCDAVNGTDIAEIKSIPGEAHKYFDDSCVISLLSLDVEPITSLLPFNRRAFQG